MPQYHKVALARAAVHAAAQSADCQKRQNPETYKKQERTTASTGRKTQPVTAADTITCKDIAAAVVLRHSSSSPTHKAYQPTLLEDSALLNSVQLNCKLVGRQDLSLAATFPAGTHAQAKPPLSPSSATDVLSKCA